LTIMNKTATQVAMELIRSGEFTLVDFRLWV
jgi:hypothetical protein